MEAIVLALTPQTTQHQQSARPILPQVKANRPSPPCSIRPFLKKILRKKVKSKIQILLLTPAMPARTWLYRSTHPAFWLF